MFRLALLLTVVLLGLASCPLALFAATAAAGPPSPLERQRMRAEIAKLKAETKNLDKEQGAVDDVTRLAPFVTAIVALLGLFGTLWKQRADASRERRLDREERMAARRQRFDLQFQQTAENLGSEQGVVRAAAAASIAMFMRPEYSDFHERLFLFLLGALRFPRNDIGDKLLVRTFQSAARERIPVMQRESPGVEIDLSNCALSRVKLDGLDLSGSDLAFTNLHGADLSKAVLRRARGYRADLSAARLSRADLQEARMVEAKLVKARLTDVNLISTKLKGADATGAVFRGSRMQEVQLDRAILRGASFEGANLNNGFFRGAQFDEASIRSIACGAIAWRSANWDLHTLRELERISATASETK